MKRLFTLLISLYSIQLYAQPNYFNTEDFWSKLVYDETEVNLEVLNPKTAIIVATNRKNTEDKVRFMSEYATEKEITYFIVFSKDDKWHVKPYANITSAIAAYPNSHKDWVIYTEGMGKIFTSELDRGMSMAEQYNVNVIMLDYPSITTTKSRLGNYFFAMKQSKTSYKYFTPVLDTIKNLYAAKQMGNGNLSLFFHSMGNNFVREMMCSGKYKLINDDTWVDNLIMNAACVPQGHHKKWIDKIKFAENIYIHYNPDDFVLGAAHILSKHKQLGEKLKAPISNNAHYINFSQLVGQSHSVFLNLYKHEHVSPETWAHYNTILHGNAIDFKSGNRYWPSQYHELGWDILPDKN